MNRKLQTRGGSLIALVAAALLIAACGSSKSKPTTTSSVAPAASTTSTPSSTSSSALTIGTAKGADGTYLVGASGRALYLWDADTGGMSNCAGACAQAWPPVTASATPQVSGGVSAADISTITRSDGKKQVTYKGHPLYYFVADATSGTTKGQGSDSFGAKWWLVAPSGSAITSGGSAKKSGSGGSSSSSSSSSWG
jgi:predicted lipoprotein with Yx(FWY)xxD motif